MSTSSLTPQYITALCATMGAMAMGGILGYSSPAGDILLNNDADSNIHLSSSQNNWFSSVVTLGALIGSPFAGFCINYFGRKWTIIYSLVPVIIGWIIIIAAQNFAMLVIGRIITGFYCSLISVSVPTYIGEFSSPEIRGTLGGSFQMMVVFGILFAFSMGSAFDSFRWIAVTCAILPCICSVLMFFNKESPSYLISTGKYVEAEESLRYFRGKNYVGISSEMEAIGKSIEESKLKKATLKDLKKPYNRKPFLMSLGLMLFQQFTGVNAVLFNMTTIFERANTGMEPNLSSIITAVVQLVATLIGMYLVDKAGRKMLLLISAVFVTASLVSLGIYFYYYDNDQTVAENISWLPLASLMVFVFFFNIGYGPIPWLMMGELFSPELKELSASIATMTNWTSAFLVTVTFEPLQQAMHDYGVYWMYAGITVVNFIFVFTFVYETKGKSLQEINEHFGGPKLPLEDAVTNSQETAHSELDEYMTNGKDTASNGLEEHMPNEETS